MQFTTAIAILASAAIVSAAPMAGEQPPATGNNSGQICKVDQKQACCNTSSSGVLGGLLGGSCELNIRTIVWLDVCITCWPIIIVGQNCAGQTACCQVDNSVRTSKPCSTFSICTNERKGLDPRWFMPACSAIVERVCLPGRTWATEEPRPLAEMR